MATINDVSKRAGVSNATVSRVLNNNLQVDAELRRRVLQAIKELEFIPNSSARSLKTKRTERIALVIPDITNPFFPEVARGAQDTLDSAGFHLFLCNTDGNRERESRYLRNLARAGIDGLIITPSIAQGELGTRSHASRMTLAQELDALGVPIVGIAPESVTSSADSVTIDEERAAFQATSHLLGLGHIRVALINGPQDSWVANRRQRGFEAALRERHITADPALMEVGFFRRDGGHAAMHRVLTHDLTAVFAANDLMALGALAALHEAGRRVPDDVALVSIDNIIEAAESDPGLSTVAIPRNYEHGRVAAQLLLDRLQGSGDTSGPPRRVELDTRLIVRGSTVKGVTGYL